MAVFQKEVVSPILPLHLKTPKPKHFRYPKEILTVGDELRKERLDRGLTQHEVSKMVGANKNFANDTELGRHQNPILTLHRTYRFLGYIPKTLNVDETTLQGRLYTHRIRNGYTLKVVAQKVGLDRTTIGAFEKGREYKDETYQRIKVYIDNKTTS